MRSTCDGGSDESGDEGGIGWPAVTLCERGWAGAAALLAEAGVSGASSGGNDIGEAGREEGEEPVLSRALRGACEEGEGERHTQSPTKKDTHRLLDDELKIMLDTPLALLLSVCPSRCNASCRTLCRGCRRSNV